MCEVNWSGDCSQLPIYRQCLMKLPICTIIYNFCDSSPTYLQTCSCRMYYVVHKFPNLSRATIHLDTHSHPIIKGMCKESFLEMKNMVVDEVCRMPTVTSSTIASSMSKSFLLRHLFNKDGKGLVELLKGEKLNQMLLKFVPLCSHGIHNLIASHELL